MVFPELFRELFFEGPDQFQHAEHNVFKRPYTEPPDLKCNSSLTTNGFTLYGLRTAPLCVLQPPIYGFNALAHFFSLLLPKGFSKRSSINGFHEILI